MSSHVETDRYKPRPVRCSDHALCRAARRNVAPDALDYVLGHGRHMRRTGVVFYFLGRRDMPAADRAHGWAARLEGTVVVVASDGEIITVYRNRHAWHSIQRKLKYRIVDSTHHRPHGAWHHTPFHCSVLRHAWGGCSISPRASVAAYGYTPFGPEGEVSRHPAV